MAKKSKFEMVKNFYDNGLWKEKRVRDAVVKGWISPENFKEITGEDYDCLLYTSPSPRDCS